MPTLRINMLMVAIFAIVSLCSFAQADVSGLSEKGIARLEKMANSYHKKAVKQEARALKFRVKFYDQSRRGAAEKAHIMKEKSEEALGQAEIFRALANLLREKIGGSRFLGNPVIESSRYRGFYPFIKTGSFDKLLNRTRRNITRSENKAAGFRNRAQVDRHYTELFEQWTKLAEGHEAMAEALDCIASALENLINELEK